MPEEKVQLLHKVGPFGGVDLTTDPAQLAPTMAASMYNFVPYRTYGQAVAAKGRRTAAATFSHILTNFYAFISSNGLAYIGTDSAIGALEYCFNNGSSGGIGLPAGVTLTAGLKMRAEVYGGNVFITNGTDPTLKVSQSSLNQSTNWGLVPPLTASNTATSGAGQLTGNYYWCYTYLNSATSQESSHSPISTILVCASNQASVSYVASTDAQVTSINIYRLGGTNSSWILETTVANTTGSYTSNVADGSLTGATLVLHRDPPPAFKAICAHKDRIFGFGYTNPYPYTFTAANTYTTTPAQPSDLWFSRYAEVWSYDCVNNVLPCGRNSFGDTAVGLCSNGSVLFAFKNFTTWLVYGDSEQDFRPVPVLGIGAYSQELITSAYGLAFWVSPDGNVWQWDAVNAPVNISEGDPEKGGIQSALNTANGNFAGWSMCAFNRCLYISTGAGGPTYVFYLKTNTWHIHNYGSLWLTSLPQFNWMGGISGGNYALVDQWFGQEGDAYLSPYIQNWTTGVLDCGREESRKKVRYVIVKMPPGDSTNNQLKVTLTLDGVDFVLPPVNPRPLASGTQGVGGWYYRLSCPKGANAYSITVKIDTVQLSTTPMAISSVALYGDFIDDFQPQSVGVVGGGN